MSARFFPARWRATLLLSLAPCAPAQAQLDEPVDPPAAPATGAVSASGNNQQLFANLQRDADEFTLVNTKRRVSMHRPMFVMPATYSPEYSGNETEFVFQLSLKLRLFNRNVFFGYTQKSFWQLYNARDSRPFRETNYDPEIFYRWQPKLALCPGCGLDVGAEHESNGKDLPDSRSWNRLTGAAYWQSENTLLHLKSWYRIPERAKRSPDDPDGDDNPDIAHYYGYSELRLQRLFNHDQHVALMLRGNPQTGKGAVEFNYSLPYGDALYWNFYVFNGYGDSLIDYNHNVTRVGIGLMLAR